MPVKRFALIAALMLFAAGCSQGGPLTPRQCFDSLQSAVEQKDGRKITGLLSEQSIAKIKKFAGLVRQMDRKQLSLISRNFGCDPEKVKSYKVKDYVSLYFFVKTRGASFADIFRDTIIAADVRKDRAVLRTSSGYEIDFVREGPYWKLDISGL